MNPQLDSILTTFLSQAPQSWQPNLLGLHPYHNTALLVRYTCYFWQQSGRTAFHKFAIPQQHELYQTGMSWTEIMGWGRSKFENNRANIATKNTTGSSRRELERWYTDAGHLQPVNRLVIYWTSRYRATWYWLNETLLTAYLLQAGNPDWEEARVIAALMN